MNWLISANSKIYDYASSFEHHSLIDWRQNNTRYQQGDIVYIYCTRPVQRVRYRCEVTGTNIPFSEIRDDDDYWLDKSEYRKSLEGLFVRLKLIGQVDSVALSLTELRKQGLKSAPQSPTKIRGSLLDYIRTVFESDYDDFFPETIPPNDDLFEGIKKTVAVNKYERSSVARSMCIEQNGCICKICGFDFEKTYGESGKGFVHVHHLVPIHKIGREYRVDYKNDLMPVCPNCHAMLHRRHLGKELTPEELRELINRKA